MNAGFMSMSELDAITDIVRHMNTNKPEKLTLSCVLSLKDSNGDLVGEVKYSHSMDEYIFVPEGWSGQ